MTENLEVIDVGKKLECVHIDDRNSCSGYERGECNSCELRPYLEREFSIKFDN
ncbi:MAG: hypothetical protein KKF67_02885 [Nanoarchaeota archaeon]|nr:hypothetical protein [Nanoarchaeota archaeon]